MAIFLNGLGVRGYKSFGPDTQKFYPFNSVNIFVGQNNSGKSNVLKIIEEFSEGLSPFSNKRGITVSDLTLHRGHRQAGFRLLLPLVIEDAHIDALINKLINDQSVDSIYAKSSLRNLIIQLTAGHDGIFWFSYDPQDFKLISPSIDDILDNRQRFKIGDESIWSKAWSKLTGMSGGGHPDWVSGYWIK